MLIILSPAKTMNMADTGRQLPETAPLFGTDARFLASKMQAYTRPELEKILHISPALADATYRQYQQFGSAGNRGKQALLAYNGSVFKAINASAFSEKDFLYAQDHIRIISTLYGLVRPLDRIEAYRIAFSLKPKGIQGNLYDYWLPKLTVPLIEASLQAGGIIINLASLDVLGSLDISAIKTKVTVITPEFKEYRNGRYETIRTYAKIARGAMTRHIILNRLESPEQLTAFTWENFRFNPELSDGSTYTFTRENSRKA